MSKNQAHKNQDDTDFDDDFVEDELDSVYDLDFNDSKVMKKIHKSKSRRTARRRLEDYFERKALKEQDNDWDFNFDY